MSRGKTTRDAFELLLWAAFAASMGVTAPAVNWLAIRGTIVWIREDHHEPQ